MVEPAPERRVIRAAGTVLWRATAASRADTPAAGWVEVAVVHRPRYDDWSFPKGKVDPGETLPAAAVRELREETGCSAVLGRYLDTVAYSVRAKNGAAPEPKTVVYFAARHTGGAFVPNDEVDELRWVDPVRAREILSYPMDIAVLDEFTSTAPRLTTLLFVRHAKAGKRECWSGDDDLRPLSDAGARQAEALRALLPLFGPDRVVSAPRLRCVQTVRGLAEDLGVEVRREPALSEEDYWRDPAAGIALLLGLASSGGTPVVCSQGGVIPDLVGTLAHRAGLSLGRVSSKKGSVWLLSFECPAEPGEPVLRAAYYLPSPLAAPVPRPV